MVHVYVFIEMIFNMGISVRVDNKNNFLCCALASQNILTVMVIHFSYSAIMIIACFKEGNFPSNSFFTEGDYCLQFFQ